MEDTPSISPKSFVHELVVPGDIVLDLSTMSNQTIKLGGGLRQNFLVDVKGPTLAFLPVLAFEGVIRRNIPRFEVGTLLYARVVKANAGMNPELSCMDANGKAAEFGPLKDGFMFETSTGLARTLLSNPTCPVLEALGKKLSFETAVGLNGRVWVNAPSPSTVILVSNAIMKSESLSRVQQKIMVEKLLQKMQ